MMRRIINSKWFANPKYFKAFNGYATVFWIVMIPISIATGWVTSIIYVSALSIYAIVTGHLSTWQAGRVEVRQHEDDTEELVRIIKRILEDSSQV